MLWNKEESKEEKEEIRAEEGRWIDFSLPSFHRTYGHDLLARERTQTPGIQAKKEHDCFNPIRK